MRATLTDFHLLGPSDQILRSHEGAKNLSEHRGEEEEGTGTLVFTHCNLSLTDGDTLIATPKSRGPIGWEPSESFAKQPNDEAQESDADAAEKEARLKAEERGEMMRKTVERIEGEVKQKMHDIEHGLEQMTHQVKQTLGWEHPGGAESEPAGWMPGGFHPDRTAPSESGEHRQLARSNLSATAPEFVPTGKALSSHGKPDMKPEGQGAAASGWWPAGIPTGSLGEVFKDVKHKISESFEEYLRTFLSSRLPSLRT